MEHKCHCRIRRLNKKRSGEWGEEIALQYLSRRGYELVERSNYRTRYGEIDLILRQNSTIVFVEVKLRRGATFGNPLEAVTPRKQESIRRLAEQYIAEAQPDFDEARFDVVGVLAERRTPKIEHIKDAF